MPFGQSFAGLESLSVYRASVVQRLRTRAQYVGSMIICWCSTCSTVVANSPRNRANSLQNNGAITSLPVVTAIPPAAWIASALLPAHEPYRHNGPSRAATVLPWPSGFSPSYMKLGSGSWRDVIVARRTRKSSASFDAPAMVSLRELAGHQKCAARSTTSPRTTRSTREASDPPDERLISSTGWTAGIGHGQRHHSSEPTSALGHSRRFCMSAACPVTG
jgi:hypothetical protein